MANKKTLKTCPKGHKYYKSTDCPTCPICEEEKKPKDSFLSQISAPARRALERENITSLKQLSKRSKKEILTFHGIGPGSIPKLKQALTSAGLTFKKELVESTKNKKTVGKKVTKYHNDGTIWATGRMIVEQPDGYWEWYRKDGVIMRSGFFDNGKQTGEWTTYDKQGKVYKVTKMKNTQ